MVIVNTADLVWLAAYKGDDPLVLELKDLIDRGATYPPEHLVRHAKTVRLANRRMKPSDKRYGKRFRSTRPVRGVRRLH